MKNFEDVKKEVTKISERVNKVLDTVEKLTKNKKDEKTFSIRNVLYNKSDGSYYIIALCDDKKTILLKLTNYEFNRHTDPVSVKFSAKITFDEFSKMCGYFLNPHDFEIVGNNGLKSMLSEEAVEYGTTLFCIG